MTRWFFAWPTWTAMSFPRSVRRSSAQPTWIMRSSLRSIMTKRCFARSRWTMTSFPRSVMPRRCFARSRWTMSSFPRVVKTSRGLRLSLRGWWRRLQGPSWPDDVLRSPRGRWRLLQGHSWPGDVLRVVHVVDDVFSMTKRCSSQSTWTMPSSPRSVMTRRCSAQSTYRWWRRLRDMSWPDDVLCVVHVVYDFFSNVIHDQTMFRVVHVDYDVVPQVYHDQTMLFVVYVNYYATSSPGSIMTERCFAWFAWTMFLSPRSMTRRCSLRRGWCGLKWIYIKFSSYTFDKKMKKKTNN